MATEQKFCPKCGAEITDPKARNCSNCGVKIKKPLYKKWWFWVIIGLVVVIIIGAGSGDSEDVTDTSTSSVTTDNTSTTTDNTSTTTNSSNSTSSNVYNVGETLTANGVKITFQSCEEWTGYDDYLGPKDGYKVIRAYFVIENASNTDRTVGSYDFDCYADGVAVDSYYYGDDTLTPIQTISAGRKVQGYIYFEVPSNASDIEIEYETSFWTDKKAIFKVVL